MPHFCMGLGAGPAATAPPGPRQGPDESLPAAALLCDRLNLCSQPLPPLHFIAALSRSGGVKTRDYTVSVLPF